MRLPGISGNKGTWPLTILGTWEQKKNKTGGTGTKAYFREQGTQGKYCCEQGNLDPEKSVDDNSTIVNTPVCCTYSTERVLYFWPSVI